MAKVIKPQKDRRKKMLKTIDTKISDSYGNAEKKDRFYGYLIWGLSSLSLILIWILYQL